MASDVPRGIEILVKKAAVDAAFRELLLEVRASAAKEIGLELAPAEAAMLNAVPASQLAGIIAGARVTEKQRPAFLGKAAAVMLAALGAASPGCKPAPEPHPAGGGRPDNPRIVKVLEAKLHEMQVQLRRSELELEETKARFGAEREVARAERERLEEELARARAELWRLKAAEAGDPAGAEDNGGRE